MVTEGDIIAAGSRLAAVPPALSAKAAPDFILARGLRPLAQEYDHVVIDTPPGDNRLTSNALFAAQRMIVPVQPGSIDGVVSLMYLTEEWRGLSGAPVAELGGVVLCRAKQTRLAELTADWVRGRYKGAFLDPVVPDTVAVQQAWHDRKPLTGAVGGRATEAYGEITDRLLQRERRWQR